MLQKHLIAKTAPMAAEKNIIVHGNRRITVLTPQLFRIETTENGIFCDEATQTVWFRNTTPVNYQFTLEPDAITVTTEQATLILRQEISDSRIVFDNGNEAPLSDEGNLLGTYRTLDCCDGDLWISYDPNGEDSHPIRLGNGVISRTGVALYDDSKSLLLNRDGMVAPRKIKEQDLYIFAYGQDYRSAIKALYLLCGAPAALPRYALGNWWSRYHAYTAGEYLELMEHFEEDQIPFTVATIDMDWHPSDNLPEGIDGWTGYSWNRALFPDYKDFLRQLQEKNLHITLNLHPASGVQYIEEQYEDMAKCMGIDPATKRRIDFDFTDETFINAYFSLLHKPYEKDGVDFWWIDWQQGTNSAIKGYDPLWGLNHYHSLDIAENKEQLILSRYAGIGSHRYPVGFSGDTLVTWKTLQYLPYFTSTASNAGYTWWSHDIGGHINVLKDDEQIVRYV
ncbi:MAG: alpha-xylosidase, partial [Acetatifactor sp.]|nr:alpha-xylosidase [Acetatifactor sp.]